MKISLSITAAVTALLFLAACGGKTAGTLSSAAAGPCENADNVSYVKGAAHCLAVKTFASSDGVAKTLVVVLHGDLSRGGDADYIFPVAESASEYGAVGVAMMRPGYTGDGRRSSGTPSRSQNRWDVYRGEEVDSIAAAVAALKKHHGAERVVMVGHSGGAVISGVMLGRAAPWWMRPCLSPVPATTSRHGARERTAGPCKTQSLRSTICRPCRKLRASSP